MDLEMPNMTKGMEEQRPHAVCIPYPSQGHINPMIKLAKLLHSRAGFHITFVNTDYNHRRLLRAGSRGGDGVTQLPSFRFESIPDGLPGPEDADVKQDTQALCESIETSCTEPFKGLVDRLNDTTSSGVPPVTCIVSDVLMYFTLHVAKEVGVPNAVLWPAGLCCLFCYTHFDRLLELGILPFKDNSYTTNGELDRVLHWVPGASDIRLRDFPSFIRITQLDDYAFNFILRMMDNLKKASCILFNSFESLEHDALKYFPSHFPPLYPIGPFDLMLDHIDDFETKSIKSNLWKEDPHCITWLDSYSPDSVAYVNFGSITVMTHAQLEEFAWGLANSMKPFLWVVRPDLVDEKKTVLPFEFLEETKGRGLVVHWCDQQQVLAHPSVGGFLTHCGWNSTMESICNGVPMICWPFFADQQTNCWYSCTKWGIGAEIDHNVKRIDVESKVRELIEGERGMKMRRRAIEWKRLAQEATQPLSGSSYSNFDNVINVLLSKQ